ncbi:sensory box protein, partial [Vibrio parahaemolyticus V-223/04]
YSAMPSKR